MQKGDCFDDPQFGGMEVVDQKAVKPKRERKSRKKERDVTRVPSNVIDFKTQAAGGGDD